MIASQYSHSSDIRADTTGELDYLYLLFQNSELERWPEGLRLRTGPGKECCAQRKCWVHLPNYEQRFKDILEGFANAAGTVLYFSGNAMIG